MVCRVRRAEFTSVTLAVLWFVRKVLRLAMVVLLLPSCPNPVSSSVGRSNLAYARVLAPSNPASLHVAVIALLHSSGDWRRSYCGLLICGFCAILKGLRWRTGAGGAGWSRARSASGSLGSASPKSLSSSCTGCRCNASAPVIVGSSCSDSLLEFSLSIWIPSALSSSLESTGASSVVPEVVESASETIRAYWVVNSLKVIGGSNRRDLKSRSAASTTSSKRCAKLRATKAGAEALVKVGFGFKAYTRPRRLGFGYRGRGKQITHEVSGDWFRA